MKFFLDQINLFLNSNRLFYSKTLFTPIHFIGCIFTSIYSCLRSLIDIFRVTLLIICLSPVIVDDFIRLVNMGNPGEYIIKEFAEKIIDLTDSKSKIIYLPLPQDDPLERQPDISLAN
jgi:hypothetical protein